MGNTQRPYQNRHHVGCLDSDSERVFAERLGHAQKGTPYDQCNPVHEVIAHVLDFMCGAKWPPAPKPASYMEKSLVENMTSFQRNMTMELIDEPSEMKDPVMVTFWEVGSFDQSSEDTSLTVHQASRTLTHLQP